MTTLDAPPDTRTRAHWITDWRPEDPEFWEQTGAKVAKRNLIWSIFSEHLGFSVWLLWSVSAALLPRAGFAFTPQQLFVLVAIPNLVGSLIRLPYTFAVPKFGGRNWTVISALMLLVPTLTYAWAVQRPETPYWVFLLIAATAGLGGGNFASSMANINFFYPAAKKGAALGLNAAGGNLGVAVIQFFLPIVVGGAGAFGLIKASSGGFHLERAGFVYAALAVIAAVCAWKFMDNLAAVKSRPRDTLVVLKHKHTWIMSFLYIGTFGSFIGYSAAMPLLIKLNFWVPEPAPMGTGINFAYWAFLGALVGSVTRPLGGWMADKWGGARVTLAAFAAMILGTLGVLATLAQLAPNPGADAGIASDNAAYFVPFLLCFLFIFAATGIGNGSTYRMIPIIFTRDAVKAVHAGADRAESLAAATKKSSAVIGIAGAIGAIGGFLIPMTFGAPWVTDAMGAVRMAFAVFTGFYVVCLAVTWVVYLRPAPEPHGMPATAHARI